MPDGEIRRLIVADTITEVHQRSRGTYGRRRVRAALLAEYEMNVNHKLVNSIMSEHGLWGLPRPGRRISNLIKVNTPEDLVKRQFTATRPNELWCTDITEHPARDGKVYCCAILDCFSRMIVARTFSTTADTALVNNAVNMAVADRNRSGTTIPTTARSSRPGASGRTCADGGYWDRSAPWATGTTPRLNPSGAH
ncbi:MAG: IS3 family transposase [Mycobacterium sp.]